MINLDFDIMRELNVPSNWVIQELNDFSSNRQGSLSSAMAIAEEEVGNPEKTSIIVFRTFIEDSRRLRKKGQKYVLLFRFYSFGYMTTVDLISIDKEFHKEIAYEYLKGIDFGFFGYSEDQIRRDMVRAVNFSPYLIVGGYLKIDKEDKVIFSGSSGDFGSDLFAGVDCNDVASVVANSCGIKADMSDIGKAFVEDILSFSLENKRKKDFYEKFIQHVLDKDVSRPFTNSCLESLLVSKAFDRFVAEERDDIFRLITEEMTEGFSRFVMVSSVAKKMKK